MNKTKDIFYFRYPNSVDDEIIINSSQLSIYSRITKDIDMGGNTIINLSDPT